MNCSQCGNALTAQARFCNRCGCPQTPAEPAAAQDGLSCPQCHASCQPRARFCPQCGTSLAPVAAAARPAPAPEPPRIEPFLESAAPRPARNHNPPALPREPLPGNRSWIKWAVLALVIAAVAAGAMMARNMAGLSKSHTDAALPDKDALSAQDKARADALVGPQTGAAAGSAATAAPSTADAAAPVPQAVPAPTALPAAAPMPAPEPAQAATAGNTAEPFTAPAAKPAAKPRPAPKNGPPSLDDLLD
ncbi:zinc ribbon domain-containing protein [Comamonas guangdongensis]|uniref:Zinc ribbon domain-containing protein n=1 Tax=Comamonas guangdongensis TaxID=510515 RepID=A0ABV3ZWD0_9BURK